MDDLALDIPDEHLPVLEDLQPIAENGPELSEELKRELIEAFVSRGSEEAFDLEEKSNEGDIYDFEGLDETSDEEILFDFEEEQVVHEIVGKEKRKRRNKTLGSMASNGYNLVRSFVRSGNKMKSIDIFALPAENKSASWLQKALDAHDTVVYLESKMEDFLNDYCEELNETPKAIPVDDQILCPERLIKPGTKLTVSIMTIVACC